MRCGQRAHIACSRFCGLLQSCVLSLHPFSLRYAPSPLHSQNTLVEKRSDGMSFAQAQRHPCTHVIMLDGTSQKFGPKNTNVVGFSATIIKGTPGQTTYYQPGIATSARPKRSNFPFVRSAAKISGQLFALHQRKHICNGYEFLMNNYEEGDKICLLGFSRGGHAAQALAGMLHVVGLLPKENHENVQHAFEIYSKYNEDEPSSEHNELARKFKEEESRAVQIDFVGVWDPVSSVGLFGKNQLPYADSWNPSVKVFRVALALDERRVYFGPCLRDKVEDHQGRTDVKIVWFAGSHSDVGGGLVMAGDQRSLARISLRWMIREVHNARCGVKFREDKLRNLGVDFAGPNQQHDVDDYDAPIHDPLSRPRTCLWWLLEPWHRGKGRTSRAAKTIVIHRSVQRRMLTTGYLPRFQRGVDQCWVPET